MQAVATANFDFLHPHDANLVRLGGLAERYFRDDPSTALIKLRQYAELLAKLVAARHAVYLGEREGFDDLLRRLAYERVIPREVADVFHALRKVGNAAAHEAKGGHAEVLSSLKFARELGVWFHRTYAKVPSFRASPFVPPLEPVDATAALRAEIAALHQRLTDSEGAAEQARLGAEAEAREREGLAERLAREAAEGAMWEQMAQETTSANRVRWAKSYLGRAGLVEITRRAHFRITPHGREVLARPPERIGIKFLIRFPEFQAFRVAGEGNGEATEVSAQAGSATADLTPYEIMRAAARQLESALAGELLQRVVAGAPAFLESLVVRLLIAMGYGSSVNDLDKALIGKPGDGGVDNVIDQDPLGLDRIYVQAKRYGPDNTVGASAIRDFFGSLDRFKATTGLFVTTSTFSALARETAEMLSKRIVLIDGPQLSRLMIRHSVGCCVEETLTVKRLDEKFSEG